MFSLAAPKNFKKIRSLGIGFNKGINKYEPFGFFAKREHHRLEIVEGTSDMSIGDLIGVIIPLDNPQPNGNGLIRLVSDYSIRDIPIEIMVASPVSELHLHPIRI